MFYGCAIQGGMYFIPDRMERGIVDYIENHIMPGSFLRAVFGNNLVEAVGQADQQNLYNLPAYASYLYNEAPSSCWGSPEKVREWLRMKNCKPVEE